MSEKTLKFAF